MLLGLSLPQPSKQIIDFFDMFLYVAEQELTTTSFLLLHVLVSNIIDLYPQPCQANSGARRRRDATVDHGDAEEVVLTIRVYDRKETAAITGKDLYSPGIYSIGSIQFY